MFSLHASDAYALALGRISIQSALGEPLRAEIELPEITAAEAESLRASPASPATFRAQGLDYSPALTGLQTQVQRRPDGRTVLRLSSDRPVNDPFVDLLLEATWASGRIVRNYTLLFDPPSRQQPAPAVTVPPQVAVQAPVPAPAPAVRPLPAPPVVAAPPAVLPAPAPRAVQPPPPPAPRAPAVVAAPAAAAPVAGGSVTVRPGDTAGRIAAARKPADVSLDQMLVALLRANPDAFIGGNVNRIRAGAVLSVPDAAAAQSTAPGEARQIVAAQSRDFNEFRRRLAGAAPAATVAPAERSASGSVQTRVDEQKPTASAPDKLTLSKGSVRNDPKAAADERLAQQRQASDASNRIAELSKNIDELNRLGAAAGPASAAPAAPATAPAATTAPPVADTAATATAPAPVPAAQPGAPAGADAAAPAAPAPAPAPSPTVAKPPAATPAPAPEAPGFLDGVFDDPLVPAGGLAILLLLAGYGTYRVLKHRRAGQVDSSFLESRLQPDSFFGASGGQRVDTSSQDSTTGSSMAYSPSQLDAGGDVDPVAEADVYLAYGRDLQAEEILKEALRTSPTRAAVHAKLAEIYAKRHDARALESVAQDAFKLTQGEGSEWNRIRDLGREIDPGNSLYERPADAPSAGSFAAAVAAAAGAGAAAVAAAAPAPAAPPTPPAELDLDLDLGLDDMGSAPAPVEAASTPVAPAAEPAAPASDPHSLDFDSDFDLASFESPIPSAPALLDDGDALASTEPLPEVPEVSSSAPASAVDEADAPPPSLDLDFALDDFRPSADAAPTPPPEAEPPATSPAADDSHLLDFDLDALSLDIDGDEPATGSAGSSAADKAAPALADDPLTTKLSLAEEFNAIGDADGARALVEEVLAEATGDTKARAQRLLAELS